MFDMTLKMPVHGFATLVKVFTEKVLDNPSLFFIFLIAFLLVLLFLYQNCKIIIANFLDEIPIIHFMHKDFSLYA